MPRLTSRHFFFVCRDKAPKERDVVPGLYNLTRLWRFCLTAHCSLFMRRMKPILDTQDKVRDFNEDEAVWRRFEQKRLLRDPFSALPEEVLDEIDWHEAERDAVS